MADKKSCTCNACPADTCRCGVTSETRKNTGCCCGENCGCAKCDCPPACGCN